MQKLKEVFIHLAQIPQAESLWNEIVTKYGERTRHYHNLDHLANMLTQLELCRNQLKDWDCTLFALFYHDYIYNPTAKDNEERSSEAAKVKMTSLKLPQQKIDLVVELILATKGHNTSQNSDINYFTDADLSILGSSSAEYDRYTKNVRQEYSIYPDILYRSGRRKVLKHFIDMPQIFKTTFFTDRLEKQARENIGRELESLL